MFQPLNNTVFVKVDAIKGHDLVPEQFRDSLIKLKTGTVIAVGPGITNDAGVRIPVQVTPGDKVLFGAKVGVEIDVDKEKLLLLAEENLLGVDRQEVKVVHAGR